MKKRFITKSSEDKSDFISGHASKPYINEGIHLLDNSSTTNIFICYSTDFSKNGISWTIKTFFGVIQWNFKHSWTSNENT